MKARITNFEEKESRNGGKYIHIDFTTVTGKQYYTYIDPKKKNYHRWKKVLKVGVLLDNLKLIKSRLVNADSNFTVVEE